MEGESYINELFRLGVELSFDDNPDNFKKWVSDNADYIADAQERGTEPYFVRDNKMDINASQWLSDERYTYYRKLKSDHYYYDVECNEQGWLSTMD